MCVCVCVFFLQDTDSLKRSQGVGPIRKVVLAKEDHEGLGISITVTPLLLCRLGVGAQVYWIHSLATLLGAPR